MGLCLLFLTNVPGAMFIQGDTFIPDSRVRFNRICPASHNPGHTLLNSKLTTEALVITKTQEKKPKHFYFFVQFVIECH